MPHSSRRLHTVLGCGPTSTTAALSTLARTSILFHSDSPKNQSPTREQPLRRSKTRAPKYEQKNECEILRQHGRNIRQRIGEKYRLSSFKFQGKWPQELPRKVLHTLHDARKKAFHSETLGVGGQKRCLCTFLAVGRFVGGGSSEWHSGLGPGMGSLKVWQLVLPASSGISS